MSVGDLSVGEVSVGDVSVGEMSVGELSGHQDWIISLQCELVILLKKLQRVVKTSSWSHSLLALHKLINKKATSSTCTSTESAAKYHFLQIQLQKTEWKTLMSVQLNPLNSDCKLSNRSYDSVMTSLSAALENILHFIRCNCNSSKKNPRITSTCSCRKHGFPCISVCGDCNGANCRNYENEIDMDGGSDEKQDRNIYMSLIKNNYQ